MKVYSIGREIGCDIIINDSTDVISRRHAILNVSPSGKMTIVDQSHNGTYVNGIRISQNVPVPVTRKDNISFAHIARLDWNQVPNSNATVMKYIAMSFIAILLVAGGVIGYHSLDHKNSQPTIIVNTDSIRQAEEKLRKEEKRRQDSIQKHFRDSLEKVYKNKKEQKKKVDKKDKDKEKDDESKNITPKKEQEDNTTIRRRRG